MSYKRLLRILFFLPLLIVSQCQDSDTRNRQIEVEALQQKSILMQEMFFDVLKFSEENLEISVDKEDFGRVKSLDKFGNYVTGTYFPTLPKINFKSGWKTFEIAAKPFFSEAQLKFLQSLDSGMKGVAKQEDFYILIKEFRTKAIFEWGLSYGEKIQMIALVEQTYVLHELLRQGAFRSLANRLRFSNGLRTNNLDCPNNQNNCPLPISYCEQDPKECGGNGGCAIDWRGVWGGAVLGFAYGATTSAVAGATAGTVVFPVVGTVTGAVSAGVVGGAIGFVEGAVAGIAGSLLLTCFR
ncbi:MAG: glycine zipper family protein [Cyclobacteriaceae bacterium]|jgi:hypothetical protein